MAGPLPPRRGPGAAGGSGVATGLLAAPGLLAALGLLVALAGCAAPGALRDAGAARPVTPLPVPQALWPNLGTSPAPTSPASATAGPTEPPPTPVPDLTVPGPDLTSVDLRTLLAKDPAVSADERRALAGCPDCEVRSPEYRDLTGDGRAELIAAVSTGGSVVLHVYTRGSGGVVPVLRVAVQPGFSAETVAADLWLHEPSTASSVKSSHYSWNGTRLSLAEQRLQAVGPIAGPGQGSTTTADPVITARPSAGAASPAVAPSGAAGAAGRTGQPVPVPRPPEATSAPSPTPTSRPTAAVPAAATPEPRS
ncbi:hypothetical protein [Kitasatospora sp. NPDC059327]|uniref:hypothetical protein n=1 Tax=Kitasatospora sp. NPDC059327 TaxID=3346803 RepID=UPI0036BD9609